MAKTTKKSRVARTGRRKWLVVGVVVVSLIIGGVVVSLANSAEQRNQRAEARFAADKARFTQVEADMDEAYAAIVAAVGAPVREESSKSCSHVALKFEEGQLNCGVGRTFIYGVANFGDAFANYLKMREIVEALSSFTLVTSSVDSSFDAQSVNERGTAVNFDGLEGVACRLRFRTHNPAMEPDYRDVKTVLAVEYGLSCLQDMERPIYPLAE